MPAASERIRKVRWERPAFDGRFFTRHEDFWPIARAAERFADHEDWPDVSEYNAPGAPVRFEEAPIKRRRPAGEIVRAELYDARIVNERVVPTRPRMWHDFLNALVWLTFPKAKLALHRRQHAAIEKWIPAGATQLPNARTREQDALALIDEGGVLLLGTGPERRTMFFGHALFEGLVFEQLAMISRGVELRGSIEEADAELASLLDDAARFRTPDELPRRF
jgi:hypothetical protein